VSSASLALAADAALFLEGVARFETGDLDGAITAWTRTVAIEHLARAVDLAPAIRSLLPGFAESRTLLGDSRLLTDDD
jgi:hypothetical protein